jgi:hypothetical protein
LERRFAGCKDVLFLYPMVRSFLKQVIEGNELYTKVNRNVPNEAIRRRNSAHRRRSYTYAKRTTDLQRKLDMFWVAHRYIRVHFTTKQVTAVAIGTLKEGLSLENV